jgi:hypothetical protein
MYNLDANHHTIVEAFRKCACQVAEVAKSKAYVPGLPDLIVGVPNHTHGIYRVILVEVKTDKGQLTAAQDAFVRQWADYPVHIVRTIDDVVRVIRLYQQ